MRASQGNFDLFLCCETKELRHKPDELTKHSSIICIINYAEKITVIAVISMIAVIELQLIATRASRNFLNFLLISSHGVQVTAGKIKTCIPKMEVLISIFLCI